MYVGSKACTMSLCMYVDYIPIPSLYGFGVLSNSSVCRNNKKCFRKQIIQILNNLQDELQIVVPAPDAAAAAAALLLLLMCCCAAAALHATLLCCCVLRSNAAAKLLM